MTQLAKYASRLFDRIGNLSWPLQVVLLLVVSAGITLLAAYSSDPADVKKTTVIWGYVCDKSACSPAALLFGEIPKEKAIITDVLQQRPDVKTLCLRSQGGNSSGAASLSNWLDTHGYNTCVPRIEPDRAACASACTVVFAGGNQRQVDRDVVFAIHGGYMPLLMRELPDSITGVPGVPAGDITFLKELSISANKASAVLTQAVTRWGTRETVQMNNLLSAAVEVPGHSFRYLTPGELSSWKLTTAPADSDLVWIGKR
jgi:hypothetical protein